VSDQDQPRSEPGHATPEGYTSEEPALGELDQPGTPGAGMTPEVPHAADADAIEHGEAPAHDGGAASVGHDDPVTHVDAHTLISDDDHGHAEAALGPIDWAAWGYALLGAAGGLVVLALFWVAATGGAAG
jgi:hypothetical protein